jgi:hypothetical protein
VLLASGARRKGGAKKCQPSTLNLHERVQS